MERPDRSRSSARGRSDALRQQADAAGAKTPSTISGCPARVGRREERGGRPSASSSPPPRHCPRTATRIGTGELEHPQRELVERPQHPAQLAGRCSSTLAPKLKCGPSASSRTARSGRAAQPRVGERVAAPRSSRRRSRSPWVGASRDAQQARRRAPARRAAERQGITCRPSRRGGGGQQALDELRAPRRRRAASAGAAATKSTSRSLLRALVEGAEAGVRLGHHVEREPGPGVLLVRVPGLELGLAQLSTVFVVQSGKVSSSLAQSSLDRSSSRREIDLAALQQRLAVLERGAGLRLAVDEPAVLVEQAVGDDERVRDELRRRPSAPGRRR